MKVDSQVLRSKLHEIGFHGEFLPSSSAFGAFDLALGTACYQAFFKIVENVKELGSIWVKAQSQLAEYKNRQSGLPRDLYLAFILTDPVTDTDEDLIRHISSDALVCRKIILRAAGGQLDGALQDLPFIGLELGSTRAAPGIKYVLSVLESKGYPSDVIATLTSWAAVDKLLPKLIGFPVPQQVPFLAEKDYLLEPGNVSSGDVCTLERLSIRDFRGVRTLDCLDLSCNLTIIFGLNGTGKTSLFDALEFALVGQVERLATEAPDDLTKRSPYVNLFSDRAKVELQVSIGGNLLTVERTISASGESILSINQERAFDEHELLDRILGEQQTKVDVRTLRRLLRTGNFLSQNTLREFLSNKPTDRYWALSHLLGTQDYTGLIERINELRQELDKRLKQLDAEISNLVSDSSELKAEIDARVATLSGSLAVKDLAGKLTNLSAMTADELRRIGSPFADLLASASSNYREIKSALNVITESLNTELEKERAAQEGFKLALRALSQIKEGNSSRSQLNISLDSIRAEIASGNKEIQPILAQEEELKLNLHGLTSDLQKLNGRKAQLQHALDIAKELTVTETLEKEQRGEYESANKELIELQQQQRQQSVAIAEAESQRARVIRQLSESRRRLDNIREAEKLVSTWMRMSIDAPTNEQQLRSLIASDSEKEKQRISLLGQYSSFTKELESANVEVQVKTTSLEQLKDLLVQLQKHVTGSECPLCGHDWEKPTALLQQIRNRTNWISPEVQNLIGRQQELVQKIDLTQRAISAIDQQLAHSQALKRELESRQDSFRNLSLEARSRVNQLLDGADLPFTEAAKMIQDLRNNITQEQDRIEREFSVLDSHAKELQRELTYQQGILSMAETRVSRISDALRSTTQRSATLRNQLANIDVGLGPDLLTTITKASDTTQSEIGRLTDQRQQIEKQMLVSRSARASLESKLSALRQRQSQLVKDVASVEDIIAKATAVFQNAGLKPEDEAEEINRRLLSSQRRSEDIATATIHVVELTSIGGWLIAREEREGLEARLLQLRATTEGLADQVAVHKKWHDHLSGLALSLIDAKSKTENWQLENYEPTINLLYRRLNPHPLFGAIKILIDAGDQSLRINFEITKQPNGQYRDLHLSPTRYFSEAQLNLLALSIFLSHSFQQRWSRFVPLMLDDPVQNMDDFNVNGFVDCLRGFAEMDRQTVISTCDINFYRLMLLKLRCLNEGGRKRFAAYRLEGLTPNGPEVIQDFPGVTSSRDKQLVS